MAVRLDIALDLREVLSEIAIRKISDHAFRFRIILEQGFVQELEDVIVRWIHSELERIERSRVSYESYRNRASDSRILRGSLIEIHVPEMGSGQY